jgi:hypothetical protein
MEGVPGMRQRSSSGDHVTDDEQITTYLRRVQSSLQVPRRQRQRVVEEIENHLHDGAAERVRSGAARGDAVAQVIEELGPPEAVGTAFLDDHQQAPKINGPRRWLPMVLPLAVLAESIGLLVWNGITWLPRGLTLGQRIVLWRYLREVVVGCVISYAALLAIRRADRDRAWRWAAWACSTVCVVAYLALGW